MPLSLNAQGHIRLSDGDSSLWFNYINSRARIDPLAISISPIPETAVQITSGQSRYDDREPPFGATARDEFAGGRALKYAEDDRTRFADSFRLNTWQGGKLFPAPQEHYCTGYRNGNQLMPGNVNWKPIHDTSPHTRFFAMPFTPSANYTAEQIWLWLRFRGDPSDLTVALRADSAGSPTGADIDAETLAASSYEELVSVLHIFTTLSEALVSGTKYWIVITADANDSPENCWEVGVDTTGTTAKTSPDGSAWSTSAYDIYYRVLDADDDFVAQFFKTIGGFYFATKPDDDGAGKLYRNGYQGVADANTGALTKLKDSTQTGWAADAILGAIAELYFGPGSTEDPPWREITASASGEATVDPAWKIEHTTGTIYNILGTDVFVEVSTTGLAKPVTSVLPVMNFVYMAQGDETVIRKARFYNNAGTYTEAFDAETAKALFLANQLDTYGNLEKVVRIRNLNDSGVQNPAVSYADVTDTFATDLSFGTDIKIGHSDPRITGFQFWGVPEQLIVFKENRPYTIVDEKAKPMAIPELDVVASPKNGRASAAWKTYLWFSLLNDLARYYSDNLDQRGPMGGEGLPSDRQGPIVKLLGYPELLIAAVDGGVDNYSSILIYNQGGWHELYRAPQPGLRIRNLYYQAIPGPTPDRLWISQGSDVLYLHMPSETLNMLEDAELRFTHESHLITGKFSTNLFDVPKLWNEMKLYSESLSSGAQEVFLDYRLDEDTDWENIEQPFDEGPIQDKFIGEAGRTISRQIQFRLRLLTNDASVAPVVRAYVMESIGKSPVKHLLSFTGQLVTDRMDLQGDFDIQSIAEELATLKRWESNKGRWVVGSKAQNPLVDEKLYIIDGVAYQPMLLEPKSGDTDVSQRPEREGYYVQLTLIEVGDAP